MILSHAVHMLCAWQRYRRCVHELSKLTDLELTDIGLTRSGIMAVACACESFRGEKYKAPFYILAAAIIAVALVSSYSRAAVILFFAGSIAWVASLGLVSRSVKAPALAASLLIVMASLFLLYGGMSAIRNAPRRH